MLAKYLLPASLLLAVPAAFAQQAQPAAPASAGHAQAAAPTPQQIAFRRQMAQHADQVAVLVDQGKTGQVWDESSPVMKQVTTRDKFVSGIDNDRAKLGKMMTRNVARIFALRYQEGGSTPAGIYMNVVFATQFANGKQPQFEEVSFHFDNDKVWRTSGYTLRRPVEQPAKQAH